MIAYLHLVLQVVIGVFLGLLMYTGALCLMFWLDRRRR